MLEEELWKLFHHPGTYMRLVSCCKTSSNYLLFTCVGNNKLIIYSKNRFENGTVNFLAILSLRHGMRELRRLVSTMDNVSIHTFQLGQLLYVSLCNLKYANGKSLVKMYSQTEFIDRHCQGAIVTFNLMTEKGDYIGYAHVGKFIIIHQAIIIIHF